MSEHEMRTALRAALVELEKSEGLKGAAGRCGLSKETVAKICAGFSVREASVLLAAKRLGMLAPTATPLALSSMPTPEAR
jgi:hypothetical protein